MAANPPPEGSDWTLRLFIAGQTPHSLQAVINLHRLRAERLDARYRLEVIDLYQQPYLAQGEQLVALPAVVRHVCGSVRMVIGDLSDADHVMAGLNLSPKKA